MTINPEIVFLENLRRNPTTAVGKMAAADFEALRAEATDKGLKNVGGWMGTQIRKSVEQVLKHPGHPNQKVHGGSKGSGGASGAGGTNARAAGPAQRTSVGVNDANGKPELVNATSTPVLGANLKKGDIIDEIGGAVEITGFGTGGPFGNSRTMQTRRVNMSADKTKATASGATKESSISEDHKYRVLTEFAPFGPEPATKTVEPVEKHPGHPNQAVHGGGGGGAASRTPRDRSVTPGGMSVARGDAEGKGFGGKGSFSRNRSDRERIDRQVREAGLDPKAKVKSKAGDSDAMLTKLGEYGGGSGYHGERASAKKTGLDTARADKMLIDHASSKGWNIAQLHEFADSKNGRFFADVMIGSGPSDRNTRTAQSLLDMGAGRG